MQVETAKQAMKVKGVEHVKVSVTKSRDNKLTTDQHIEVLFLMKADWARSVLSNIAMAEETVHSNETLVCVCV